MILAIIPARGGSKSIKDKNLVMLGGKPLIAHSIEYGQNCKNIDKLIVSTDSPKIADVARHYGAEIPFLRPSGLATDSSPVILAIKHAIKWMENNGSKIDYVILLQPTTPFRQKEDVEHSLKLIKDKNTDSVVTVCETEHNPYFVMAKLKNGYLKYPLIKTKNKISNRQQAPKVYRLNGCIYTVKKDIVINDNTLITTRTKALIMPVEMSVDIDNRNDLDYAEFLLSKNKKLINF